MDEGSRASPIITLSFYASYTKNVYFLFLSTEQFIKGIQMTYLHEARISEAQYVSTHNGSLAVAGSSCAQLTPNMDPYYRVIHCFDIELLKGPQS
jgi:hypothetical protein